MVRRPQPTPQPSVKCALCHVALGFDGDAGLNDLIAAHVCAKPRRSRRRQAADVAMVLAGLAVLVLGVAMNSGALSVRTVMSGSMRPGIQPGDLAVLQKVDSSALHVGDVIAYAPPDDASGLPVMHRIVTLSVVSDGVLVTTKGDANNVSDRGPVRLDATAYRAVAMVPFLGWLEQLRLWIWLLIAAILLVMSGWWLKGVAQRRLR